MNKRKQKEARERANQLLGQLTTGSVTDVGMASSDDGDDTDDSDTGIVVTLIVSINFIDFYCPSRTLSYSTKRLISRNIVEKVEKRKCCRGASWFSFPSTKQYQNCRK